MRNQTTPLEAISTISVLSQAEAEGRLFRGARLHLLEARILGQASEQRAVLQSALQASQDAVTQQPCGQSWWVAGDAHALLALCIMHPLDASQGV